MVAVSVDPHLGEGMPMEEPASARLFDAFAQVSDPRRANARHRLFDIFVTLIGSRALSQLPPNSISIMWLLTPRWSNPMKHLIPYLQDDQKAADYLRQVRWPTGVTCPRCGSAATEPRERCDNGLQRFNCMPCAKRLGQQFAMFTDWTGSIFEESKLRPLDCLLVIGLWQLKLNATEIAAAADIQERTAQRCINLLDGGI